jgi:hypothetical protein
VSDIIMFKKMILLTIVPMLLLSAMIVDGMASPGTTVYVDPKESKVKLGQTFEVNVNIANVSGLQGFDFCLSYDTTILDALDVSEGPFMRDVGLSVVVKSEIDDCYEPTLGRVWFAVVLCGNVCVNGSGTLATLTFNATAAGECLLDLHSILPFKPDEVKLATCGGEHIPNVAIDGYVVVSSDPCDPPENPPPDPPPDPPPNPPTTPNPDVNGDGIVDIMDLAIVASLYGTSAGHSRYNPATDLDQNGEIDILDLAIVARSFGQALQSH